MFTKKPLKAKVGWLFFCWGGLCVLFQKQKRYGGRATKMAEWMDVSARSRAPRQGETRGDVGLKIAKRGDSLGETADSQPALPQEANSPNFLKIAFLSGSHPKCSSRAKSFFLYTAPSCGQHAPSAHKPLEKGKHWPIQARKKPLERIKPPP